LPIADESIACAVTSPPYNAGIEYDATSDTLPWAEYNDLAYGACRELGRVLISGGRAWINVTPVVPGDNGHRVSLLELWSEALRSAGFNIWDFVVWPTPGRGGGTAWGSWESPSCPNMRGEWEIIIAAYKDTWARPTPPERAGWRDRLGGWTSLVSNVWKMHPEPRILGGHPAPFPSVLAQRAIRLSTWPGETVLDPFCGGGTTLRAAVDLGRRAVGVDLSERYCDQSWSALAQGSLFGETA
jgi:site-specific DNA-methyltransferase (adenine-specific)